MCNYEADKCACVCLGQTRSHVDLMSVNFERNYTVIFLGFLFSLPQLLFKCSVMWSLASFPFLSFVQTRHERLLVKSRKQGGPPETK